MDARGGIDIGWDVVIASHVLLVTADHDLRDPGFPGRLGPIAIGDRAWLASRSTVVRGVTIGDGCVIGAHSFVDRSLPAGSLAWGAPCRIRGRVIVNHQGEVSFERNGSEA